MSTVTVSPAGGNPLAHRNMRIDVVRATAIAWVIVHHFWSYSRNSFSEVGQLADGAASSGYNIFNHFIQVLEFSSLGVKLFWFVSGFCIHTAFLNWWNRRPDTSVGVKSYFPSFFLTRFWRIYPPYLLVLLAAFTVEYWGKLDLAESYRHLAVHIACVHNYFEAFIYNISWSFWSIAVETQRYLLYPLFLMLWVRIGANRAFLVCVALSAGVQIFSPSITDAYWINKNPVFFWFDWLIGAYLAERWRAQRTLFRRHGPLLIIFGGIYITSFVTPFLIQTYTVKSLLQPIVCAIAFEWYIHRQTPFNWIEALVAPLGTISFSVFLLHEPILRWSAKFVSASWPELSIWMIFGLGLPLYLIPVIFVGRLHYRWVEQPSNRVGKALAKKYSLTHAATAAITVKAAPLSSQGLS